jgi:hypothetical protein
MRISVVVTMRTTYSDDFEIFEKSRGFLFTLRDPEPPLPRATSQNCRGEEKWQIDGCRPQPVATWLPY